MSENPEPILPRWASRVEPELIRRLYLRDANGLLDEALLDEVFYALYCRCLSIAEVTAAYDGHITCPVCRTVFHLTTPIHKPSTVLHCPACDWTCLGRAYHATFKGKDLKGHNFKATLDDFLKRFPTAESPAEKMLLIDRLIHAVHQGSLKSAACNFLRGSATQLRAFLDELAYGEASTPGLTAVKEEWDATQREHTRIWDAHFGRR